MKKAKSFDIPKQLVADAFQKIKANRGAAGVDEQSIDAFEEDLKGNLYRVWNRMASGSYFPPPVKAVAIPKKRPYIQGWVNYYCRFYKTGFARTGDHLNTALIRWAMRKYARLRGHRRRAKQWLARLAARQPNLFPHWKLGFRPVVG